MMSRSGRNIEPCGTPKLTSVSFDLSLADLTKCLELLKYNSNTNKMESLGSYIFCIFGECFPKNNDLVNHTVYMKKSLRYL